MRIIADEQIPFIKDYYSDIADLHLLPGRSITAEAVRDADVLLVRSITKVNEALLSNSNVKFVGTVTAGTDHLDLPWLKSRGITVAAAPGFNAPPVADYVVSVIATMQGRGLLQSPSKKSAVIGVGEVGSRVAAHLKTLGFEVVLCDPLRAANEPDFQSTALCDIHEMDLITLHVPLTLTGEHTTHHLLDDAFFARQKTNAVFINASRGAVIETAVLLRAAKTQTLCLDVFENEPDIHPEILKAAALTTPHIAGYSVQSKCRGIAMIDAALQRHGFIPTRDTLIEMPCQTLSFAGDTQTWRDVVLGVFNPLIMTVMMREVYLKASDSVKAFDELRHQFNYRHEFGYTEVRAASLLTEEDQRIVNALFLSENMKMKQSR